MRIAVVGCGHGTLDAIYASIKQTCAIHGWEGVDLLIVGGDFQAIRNSYDLNTMSVPKKYRTLGDFHKYYSGTTRAPYLTIFTGGNHESSSYMQELYYGGWAAPNIYYLGAANVIRFGGLRIAGLSGIWKGYNYNKPHFEKLPYTTDEVKSLYHVREMDVRKLLLIKYPVDIGLSHDWPRGIEWEGDHAKLFRQKDHLEPDARAGTLGSTAAGLVLERLRPRYWFAAHLHCKFAAIKTFNDSGALAGQSQSNGNSNDSGPSVPAQIRNEDEIDLDLDDEPEQQQGEATTSTKAEDRPSDSTISEGLRAQLPAAFTRPPAATARSKSPPIRPPAIVNKVTNFLALDKALPQRDFLQIVDIESQYDQTDEAEPLRMRYDKEWLALLRVFREHDPHLPFPHNQSESKYTPLIEEEEKWVEENLVEQDKMMIPENFTPTGPFYDGANFNSVGNEQSIEYSNPQTQAFCQLVGIPNWFDESNEARQQRLQSKSAVIEAEVNASHHHGGPGGRRHHRGRGGGRGNFRGGSRGGRGGHGRRA